MTKQEEKYSEILKNIDAESSMESAKKHYSEDEFWKKILKYGKKAGAKTAYYSLVLFYTTKNPAVPTSAKMTILGALGYLIFPVDLIPDFIPVVGLFDDASIIAYALYKVISHIDENSKIQAHEKMKSWFGENYDDGDLDKQFLPKE